MGKGSKQRPGDKKKFNENWEKIFGKKDGINNTSSNEDVSCAVKEEKTQKGKTST